MASSFSLLLFPFLFILISSVSSRPSMSPLSPHLSPAPQIPSPFHAVHFIPFEEEITFSSTSPPPLPPPHAAGPPLLSPELPRVQEVLNSSQEFTLNNTTASAPLPRIPDSLDFSQEFSLNNISTPSSLPRIQMPVNSSQEFSLHNSPSRPPSVAEPPFLPPELPPALPPLPRMQEPLNSSMEFTLQDTSTPVPPPGIQEPRDSSQEFTFNNTSTMPLQPFLYPSTIETAPPALPPTQAAEPPLLPPELSPTPLLLPRMEEPLNSSQELTLNNTLTSAPLPGNQDLDFSRGFSLNNISAPSSLPRIQMPLNSGESPPLAAEQPLLPPELPPTSPPLPRMQEPLNSSMEFTLKNTSTSAPLQGIQDPLDFSQEFSFDNISAPSSLPRIQIPLNSSEEFTLYNISSPPPRAAEPPVLPPELPPAPPPFPRMQEPLNSSLEFTLQNTSTSAQLPRIQDPLDFSQEFSFDSISTIETTPPTPTLPQPEAIVTPLPSLNSSAITTTLLPTRTSLVPAFFILGDSSVDSGTNNFLGTLARADRPPYGRDFDSHQPTGRFCNGRIPVDFLALKLGLPFVPTYLGQNGTVEDMLQGVNYASAGAGIIFSSGQELGQRVSFTQQIQQFTDTLQTFTVSMGEDAATYLISKSVFYISVGINDYIHYYLRNASNVQNLYFPWSFNQFLAYTLRNEIKNLYAMSVRKVVVMGLPPIGCAPHYLWKYRSQNGKCVQEINDMILEFNFIMRYIVQGLRGELPGANIIFCDVYEASMDIIENSEHYGFNVTSDACCGWGRYKGWIMCISPEMACKNASNHIWWDQYHPTDAVNAILADNVWNGLHAKICYPMSLEEMVTAKAE